ncbi:related to isoamyl alcohol oxidase [Cephalotrichum gorgonifer]|uniref:Related to isoamyl alcohol oxidase n=1 Tax=Cephalotrichum gorgonifer TaxID=2041049 RepID=A0AAE8N1D3_9PEZI|nr:related to isoamyl alcohol oxidase [Cephalotrichum gorgonifer]
MRLTHPTLRFLLGALLPVSSLAGAPRHQCKTIPGDSEWPSPAKWEKFNNTLEGRLLQPVPPAAVCHAKQATFDSGRCQNVTEAWSDWAFHVEDPISMVWNQFTNDTCLPGPKYPCSPEGYPAYVVNATTAEHVRLSINFARKHNIRLNVKNTGHDYLGRSNAPNSLSIWVHHMQDVEVHTDGFKPKGCNVTIHGSAVTAGPGTMLEKLYDSLDAYNLTIVGGNGRTVGIAGYVTGGGHSPLSPRYGLGADNVLEVEMVVPSGDIITVNEYSHPDLFWAGGGSTFGVITSITLRSYETPKVVGMRYMMMTDHTQPEMYDIAAYILGELPRLGDEGVSGSINVMADRPNPAPAPGTPDRISGMVGYLMVQDTTDPNTLLDLWKPVNDTINKRWPGAVKLFVEQITTHDSYRDFIQGFYDEREGGVNQYTTSRLLDNNALTSDPEALSKAARGVAGVGIGLSVFLVSGKGVHQVDIRGGGNAVNPGWRSSYALALAYVPFSPLNETARLEAEIHINEIVEPFRKLSHSTGSYLNEAFPYEPNWQQAFWGDNYERLVEVKRSVDPDDVFWCFTCVGSEAWSEVDGRILKGPV